MPERRIALPPLTMLRALDTCRLIPSRFVDREDSVLAPLADNDADLQALFALDNATNERLLAEAGRSLSIGIDELVAGVPYARIVNGAFCYPHPQGSRFNDGERGAWYCALTYPAALAEVVFHKTLEYQEIDVFDDIVQYQEFLADITASLHDLRAPETPEAAEAASTFADCLDPASYAASQTLAQRLLDAGALGVVYPSVRRRRGTNIACFRPAIVANVREGRTLSLCWQGSPTPKVALHAAVTARFSR